MLHADIVSFNDYRLNCKMICQIKYPLSLILFISLTFNSFSQDKVTEEPDELFKSLALIGKKAPHFNSNTISGKLFDLSLMKDTVVVLNFWFIQCKPCKAEIPYLNKLNEEFKGEKFKLISLAWNNENELINANDSLKINYEIIPDCKWISDKYFVNGYPRTFVIKKGKIKTMLFATDNPEQSFEEWKKKLNNLL